MLTVTGTRGARMVATNKVNKGQAALRRAVSDRSPYMHIAYLASCIHLITKQPVCTVMHASVV